ncbi:Dixin, partial [Ophiophagus hannah]
MEVALKPAWSPPLCGGPVPREFLLLASRTELPHSHSTPAVSSSACTKVLYFTDRSLTPFMVFHDDDIIPGWEGKIVAWVEEDHGEN